VAQDPPAGQPVLVSQKLITLHVVASPDPVTDVRGIGPAAAERLAEGAVRTVGDLASLAPEEAADLLGVGLERARELVAEATVLDDAFALEEVEGVDHTLASLLVRAEVRTLDELRAAEPAALARTLRAVAEEHPPAREVSLTAARLRPVIAAARRS
jgi:hypothetical protein